MFGFVLWPGQMSSDPVSERCVKIRLGISYEALAG